MNLKRLIFATLFTPLFVNAQTGFYNKGSAVYVQEQGLIAVQGGLVNDAGNIHNDGTIEVTGDFENKNSGTFQVYNNSASKERAVKFMGSGTQNIKGTMSTTGQASFYNLVVDKQYASDTVQMQTNVVVEGSLVFGTANTSLTYAPANLNTNNNQKGLLQTYASTSSEYLLDIQNGNADAIAGYPVLDIGTSPSTGFILTSGVRASANGGLQRAISSATSYVFPVGTATKGFNGVMLNFSQIPGGGSVKSKFCDGSSNTDGYVGTVSQYCADCPAGQTPDNTGYNRYVMSNSCNGGAPQWIIFDHTAKNHGYWSFASTNTGYQYDMQVFPNSFEDYIDQNSTWRVLKHEAAYGDDPSLASIDWRPEVESLVSNINDLSTYTRNTGCFTGIGVPGGSYRDFSHFTMGGTNSNNALPVKFLSIKATPTGKHHIKVSWATAIEINNQGFEVMRSTDATNFTDIGWVPGNNYSTSQINYSYDDRVTDNTIYYYKLRQVDNNGKFSYSQVVEARITDGTEDPSGISIYPNPTANELNVNIKDPSDEMKVMIYNMQGKLAYENIFTVEQKGQEQTFNLQLASILPPGAYILNASSNNVQYKEKVILQ